MYIKCFNHYFFTAQDNTRADEVEEEVEEGRRETWQALNKQEEKERCMREEERKNRKARQKETALRPMKRKMTKSV